MRRWKYGASRSVPSSECAGTKFLALLGDGATEARLFVAPVVAAGEDAGEITACLCCTAADAVRVLSDVMVWCRESGRDPCVEFSTSITGYHGDMRAARVIAPRACVPGHARARVRVEGVRVTDWRLIGCRGLGVGVAVAPAPPHLFPAREASLDGVETASIATLRAGRGVALEVSQALAQPAAAAAAAATPARGATDATPDAPAFRIALVISGDPDRGAARALARIVSS